MKNLFFTLFISLSLFSCIIENPKPEGCVVQEITVTEIKEGSTNDIVFKDAGTDYFYINRGFPYARHMEFMYTTFFLSSGIVCLCHLTRKRRKE